MYEQVRHSEQSFYCSIENRRYVVCSCLILCPMVTVPINFNPDECICARYRYRYRTAYRVTVPINFNRDARTASYQKSSYRYDADWIVLLPFPFPVSPSYDHFASQKT